MVGLKNKNKSGHIRKNLTQNGKPQRPSWGTQKKKNNNIKKKKRRRRKKKMTTTKKKKS